jgi:hypothetical protein
MNLTSVCGFSHFGNYPIVTRCGHPGGIIHTVGQSLTINVEAIAHERIVVSSQNDWHTVSVDHRVQDGHTSLLSSIVIMCRWIPKKDEIFKEVLYVNQPHSSAADNR